MKNSLTFCLLFQFITAFPQGEGVTDDGEIHTDRPGHVISAKTCGTFNLLVQTGYRFQRYTYTPFTGDNSYTQLHIFPTTLRFGLTEQIELYSNWEFYRIKRYDWWTNATSAGSFLYSPLVGGRYTFLSGDKWIPTLAVRGGVRYKAPDMGLNFGSELGIATNNDFGRLEVSTSIALVWLGWDTWQYHKLPNYIPYAFKASYNFGTITAFAEAFGDLTWPDMALDAGVAFYLGDHFVLDFSGGSAEGMIVSEYWFAEAGLTYRVDFNE